MSRLAEYNFSPSHRSCLKNGVTPSTIYHRDFPRRNIALADNEILGNQIIFHWFATFGANHRTLIQIVCFNHVQIIPKIARMSSHRRCERENGTSEAPVSQRSSDNLLRVVVTPVVLVDGVERSVEVAPMDDSIAFDAEDVAG